MGKGGFTLVEQIVSFALFCLLIAAASFVITASLKVYAQVKSTGNAEIVARTLMDKITGEISGALPSAAQNTGSGTNHHITVSHDGKMIEFDERSGSAVYMYCDENGKLVVHYRPVSDGTINLAAVDWGFDEGMYKGYSITELTFSIVEGTNVIKVDLSVSRDDGSFDFTSFAECFNYENEVENITYGSITTD